VSAIVIVTADDDPEQTAAEACHVPIKFIGGIQSVAWSPDGTKIAIGRDQVRVWDVAANTPAVEPFGGHIGDVYSVAWSPDGTKIASGGWDRTVRVWDAATGDAVGQPIPDHTQHPVVAWSPDSTKIAITDRDTVRVWDATSGTPVGEPFTQPTGGVTGVMWSPDGTRIAGGVAEPDSAVWVWDAASGTPLGEPLAGHTPEAVFTAASSPDGTTIASAAWDGTVRLWDAVSRTAIGEPLVCQRVGVRSVAFSPDGTKIATGAWDDTVRVWDAATGTLLVGESILFESDD
jgi:WD40 repeat protein